MDILLMGIPAAATAMRNPTVQMLILTIRAMEPSFVFFFGPGLCLSSKKKLTNCDNTEDIQIISTKSIPLT
jgi:hypothetical protein